VAEDKSLFVAATILLSTSIRIQAAETLFIAIVLYTVGWLGHLRQKLGFRSGDLGGHSWRGRLMKIVIRSVFSTLSSDTRRM
jgi:hypothetical protein